MNILFITLSNVGDVILTLPVLTALKDNFPGSKIDVVVSPRSREIFTKDPQVNRIFSYDKHKALKDKIAFVSKLCKEKYDLAVDMKNSLLPVLIGAKKRTPLFFRNKTVHKRSANLEKLDSLGIKYKEEQNIYIHSEDRKFIGRLLEKNGVKKTDSIIGISPSCRSLLKQWRTDRFIEVIKEILKKGGAKVILIGDSDQVSISKKITTAVQDRGLIDLTGKTNLNQFFALIERMNLLVTCDSAALHIASDIGIKVVAIFGPTDAREYGPTSKDSVVVRKDLECSPCNQPRCRFNHECMSQLTSKDVLAYLSLHKKSCF